MRLVQKVALRRGAVRRTPPLHAAVPADSGAHLRAPGGSPGHRDDGVALKSESGPTRRNIVLIDEILRAARLRHRADDAILAHPPAASSRVCSLADASRSSGVAVTRGHEPLVLPRPYQV